VIEVGLIAVVLLILAVVGAVALAVFVGVTLIRVVFRLVALVVRLVFWPLRQLGGGVATAQHRCPRPSCAQCNPEHARFCTRCGRALTYVAQAPQPRRADPISAAYPIRTPSGAFRR